MQMQDASCICDSKSWTFWVWEFPGDCKKWRAWGEQNFDVDWGLVRYVYLNDKISVNRLFRPENY
jgi:hypothetical protein